MKLGVVSIGLLLMCAGPVLGQTNDDDDDDAPAKPSVSPPTSSRPSSLKAARKVAGNRCVAEIRAQTPGLSGNDRRNAVLTCLAKAMYGCAASAQEQKVQREKRLEFMDACLRAGGKS